jgi:tetrathionate reductase subunit B
VKKGAKGLPSKAVQLGPNCRYYGTKKADMELLNAQAPQELGDANLRRRMLASMVKPAMKQVQNIGLAGLAGTLLVKSLQEDKDE